MPCQPPSVEQEDAMHSLQQIRRRYWSSSTDSNRAVMDLASSTTGVDGLSAIGFSSRIRPSLQLNNTNDRAAHLVSILDEALDICRMDFGSE